MNMIIMFSGLPRIVEPAISFWKEFIKRHDADVAIHTWDDGTGNDQKLIKIFNPIVYWVDKPLDTASSLPFSDRLVYSNPYSVMSMWTSVKRCHDMATSVLIGVDQHYARIIKKYDVYMRARFDVIGEQFNLLPVLENEVVFPGKPAEEYSFKNEKYPGWQDHIAYGGQYGMTMYCMTQYIINDIYNEGSPFFSEFFLSTGLHRHKIKTTHQSVWTDIIRA